VRRIIGYQRYASKEALEMLNRIYSLLRLYTNFFQPSMKLIGKRRHGAKVYKTYDEAQIPCYLTFAFFHISTKNERKRLNFGLLMRCKPAEITLQ